MELVTAPPCLALQDYQRMLDLMRDIILATDLAHHLRIFKDLQKMAEGEAPALGVGVGTHPTQAGRWGGQVPAVPKVLV